MTDSIKTKAYMCMEDGQDKPTQIGISPTQIGISPTQIMISPTQQLMTLPFELMRQYLESMMVQQLEIATAIYTRQAEELDNAFMVNVDKFEATINAQLEKSYSA